MNEASGQAAVHCVIIGFARHASTAPRLFDYATPTSDPHEIAATNINPYLVDADNILLSSRTRPISAGVSEMDFGSMANDGGALLLDEDARIAMVTEDGAAAAFIRPFFQVDEFLYNQKRWCLWLAGRKPGGVSQDCADHAPGRRVPRQATCEQADGDNQVGSHAGVVRGDQDSRRLVISWCPGTPERGGATSQWGSWTQRSSAATPT